jgi:death on curing protein
VNAEPWSHLITHVAIQQIHDDTIVRFGGDNTPQPKQGCVEGSMGAAWNAELYTDDDSSSGGLCFAGCLLYYLVKNHCFVDGNKRVGWAACMEVLRSLGLTVDATDEEVEAFVTAIADNSPEVASALDVPVWLAPRLRAL